MRFKEIFEAFKDMGNLSDLELRKGKALDKTKEENFSQVSGRVFYKVISKIRSNDIARGDEAKGLETLTVYSVSDYNQMNCFLGRNNSSGYCVKQSELVSVFSSQKSSGSAIVQDAIKNGAKNLDCFALMSNGKISGNLYSLYLRNGFKIDKSLNTGKLGVPYTIQNGISRFVNSDEEVEINNPAVVVFMKL